MKTDPQPFDVLWTGGWDSTYRILYLTLVKRHIVQPHYILDRDRASARCELGVMEKLRSSANARRGSEAIRAPRIAKLEDIPLAEEAAARADQLSRRHGIGVQYVALSEYARQQGIPTLELGIHVDDKAWAVAKETAPETAHPTDDSYRLFERFTFPLLDTTKLEMRERAKRYGFLDLLEQTWFCHIPTRSGQPCGFCNPCRWTAEEGLAYRLPRSARVRRKLNALIEHLPSYRLRTYSRRALRALG